MPDRFTDWNGNEHRPGDQMVDADGNTKGASDKFRDEDGMMRTRYENYRGPDGKMHEPILYEEEESKSTSSSPVGSSTSSSDSGILGIVGLAIMVAGAILLWKLLVFLWPVIKVLIVIAIVAGIGYGIFKLVQLIRGMARSIPRNKIFTENYTKSVNLKDKINVITQTKDATKLITSLKAERKSKEISELTPVKATKPKVEIKSSLAERNV